MLKVLCLQKSPQSPGFTLRGTGTGVCSIAKRRECGEGKGLQPPKNVAYHDHATLHRAAISTILRDRNSQQWGLLSAHMPRHTILMWGGAYAWMGHYTCHATPTPLPRDGPERNLHAV